MAETKESREAKASKEAEKEPQFYRITLLNGVRLSVAIDPDMNLRSIDDFSQFGTRAKEPDRIIGNLEKTGERVVIRWEAVAYVERPARWQGSASPTSGRPRLCGIGPQGRPCTGPSSGRTAAPPATATGSTPPGGPPKSSRRPGW